MVQAFPKGSQLAIDFSTAILTLSESGDLQRIYDQWLSTSSCSNSNVAVSSNQLGLGTFWGLFLITGLASLVCCIIYLIRMALLHKKMADRRISKQVLLLYTFFNLYMLAFVVHKVVHIVPSKSDQIRNLVILCKTSRLRACSFVLCWRLILKVG